MNVNTLLPIANLVLEQLHLDLVYTSDGYRMTGIQQFKDIVRRLEGIPIVQNEVDILESALFKIASKDEYIFPFEEKSRMETSYSRIVGIMLGIKRLGDFYSTKDNIPQDGSAIRVLLPPLESFQDLENIANDFKRTIDVQVTHPAINGSVEIKATEKGSIWLIISLGTVLAAKLVGAIFWASAVIRRENAKAKMFEAHAKTLEIKNEMLQGLVDAQKKQINNILQDEANAIATNHFDSKDPEVIERLKMSINSASELIEKGTKVLPISDKSDVTESFPNFNQLDIIQSQIKELKQG